MSTPKYVRKYCSVVRNTMQCSVETPELILLQKLSSGLLTNRKPVEEHWSVMCNIQTFFII